MDCVPLSSESIVCATRGVLNDRASSETALRSLWVLVSVRSWYMFTIGPLYELVKCAHTLGEFYMQIEGDSRMECRQKQVYRYY